MSFQLKTSIIHGRQSSPAALSPFSSEGGTSNMKEYTLTKAPVVCLLTFICCFLWGSAFPCIKIGYQLFHITSGDTSSQILFAGIRFTLAGILTLLIGSIASRKILCPGKGSLKPIAALSMVQTVIQYIFFYIGLAHTTGVKSSIIEASSTFLRHSDCQPHLPVRSSDYP